LFLLSRGHEDIEVGQYLRAVAGGLQLDPATLDYSSLDTTKAVARALKADYILLLATQRSQVNDPIINC
jgi:hypothetical protein